MQKVVIELQRIFLLTKTLVEAPCLLSFPILFGTIAYWSVGFQPIAECFGIFLACLISFSAGKLKWQIWKLKIYTYTFLAAGSLFICIGTLSPNIHIAEIISPLIAILFMLFGGFYVNIVSKILNCCIYNNWCLNRIIFLYIILHYTTFLSLIMLLKFFVIMNSMDGVILYNSHVPMQHQL